MLRSWIGESGLVGRAAWISVPREERDSQRFWISVADAMRDTVLATRHEPRIGLHQLRLEGELTEIRSADLDFTREEARALFEATVVTLSGSAKARLHDRTEGWAAGLRLAALSLAGHPETL